MRDERDQKRLVARALGVTVELQYLDVPLDELHRRIAKRTTEGAWGSYPMTPEQLDGCATLFQPPDASELALFDAPTKLAEPSIDGSLGPAIGAPQTASLIVTIGHFGHR